MKRFILAAFVGVWSTCAQAQSSFWDGPGCQDGAQAFAVCSREPPSSVDPSECYLGRSQDYTPDPIQMDLIKVCQAAKVAADAPNAARADQLNRVIGLLMRITPDIQDYPNFALANGDATQSLGRDTEKLGADMITYSGSGSDDDWQSVVDDLGSITADAEVWGMATSQ